MFLRDYAACEADFESLHDRRGSFFLRFADQEVNVLGHNHVADNDELIPPAHLLKHSQQQVTAARSAEQWLSAKTTASDEM